MDFAAAFLSDCPRGCLKRHKVHSFSLLSLLLISLSALSLQPLAKRWRLMPKDAAKMPESAWKLVFYTMSWSYSTYLLFLTSYPFFHDPPSVFYSKAPSIFQVQLLTLPFFAGICSLKNFPRELGTSTFSIICVKIRLPSFNSLWV